MRGDGLPTAEGLEEGGSGSSRAEAEDGGVETWRARGDVGGTKLMLNSSMNPLYRVYYQGDLVPDRCQARAAQAAPTEDEAYS